MTTYAKQTTVAPEKTRQEIEEALARYGADAFSYATDQALGRAAVMFRLRGRVMRFSVPLPGTGDPAIQRTSTGRQRTSVQLREAANQALRQRWRALLLYIKAALEMVENDVMTVEQAFLQAVVLPNGATIGELTEPHIERFALEGRVPAMLGGPPQ